MRHARTFGLLLGALVLLGTTVAVAGGAAPSSLTATALTPDSTFVGEKSVSGGLAQTDPSLLGKTSPNPAQAEEAEARCCRRCGGAGGNDCECGCESRESSCAHAFECARFG